MAISTTGCNFPFNSEFSYPECTKSNSNGLLKLLVDLQHRQSIEDIISIFRKHITPLYKIDGLRYRHLLLGIDYYDGCVTEKKHIYNLVMFEKSWGSITFYAKTKLTSLDKHQLDAITFLLTQPIILAITQRTNSIQALNGNVTCLENPLLTEQLAIREARLARKEQLPMTIVLLAVDHFKKISKQYGQMFGDKLLYSLIVELQKNIQATDLLLRYSQDMFCLILKGVKGNNAFSISERLRHVAHKKSFTINNNTTLQITLSSGIAELEKSDSFETLFKRANNALLHAQKMGSNSSILADGRFITH